ncbi:MAG: 30S ribosome-binding factor RbfA [Thermodesulfobacteriota bacterium]
MTTRRVARAQDLIREEVSRLLLFKVKDPRLKGIGVTSVKMTSDLRRAVIMYSVLDDEADREEARAGLERAKGFIRRAVGQAIQLKFVPEIVFEYDRSLDYARHMDRVLKEIAAGGETKSREDGE